MSVLPLNQQINPARRGNERADIGTNPLKTEQIEELKRKQQESELRQRELEKQKGSGQ